MRGSCWLSALLSVSYPDAISISLTFGKAQALFSPPRRTKAAVSLDNADAAVDAATARLTHYEKRRIRDSAIPVRGTTPATASGTGCAARTPIRRDYTKWLTNSDPERDGAAAEPRGVRP